MLGYLPGSRRQTVPHELHHHLELSVDLLEELRQVASTEIRSSMRIQSSVIVTLMLLPIMHVNLFILLEYAWLFVWVHFEITTGFTDI